MTASKKAEFEHLIGKTVRIIDMNGEPQYNGKVGVVKLVDDMGQLHGSWSGCAIIPGTDDYEIIEGEDTEGGYEIINGSKC